MYNGYYKHVCNLFSLTLFIIVTQGIAEADLEEGGGPGVRTPNFHCRHL